MFAGLKGSDINGRWYSFMQEHLVRPVCAEFRHDLGLPTIEEMPLTQNESELVLGVNSRIFYLGVRKFIYGVDTPENVDARSDERRVGQECVVRFRLRWTPDT